jgi:hypothetical protein
MIRKINKGNKQYGIDRLKLIGLTIEHEEGSLELTPEGPIISPLEGEEPITLKKGISHSIVLPHYIKVSRNAVMVSISPEVTKECNSISFPTLLSSGFEGQLTINLRARQDIEITEDFIKLSVVTVEA